MKRVKNYILAGLLVWLPFATTLWIISFLIHTINLFIPAQILNLKPYGVHIPGIGLIIALVILIITGIIARNIVGQKLISAWDRILFHIPIVKSIYKGVKKVSDTLLAGNSHAFRKAILVKFPHERAWTIAFITGTPNNILKLEDEASDYINVYVPTTPNPTSGYFIIVHKSDTKEIALSVDEALHYIISMGTIEHKQIPYSN
jgi:uncharacterized membrane protein